MKTLKFKSSSTGRVSAQHPMAEVGPSKTCITYEVTEIPDGIEAPEVQRLLDGTTTVLAENAGRYSYKFAELGVGVILRGA